ncbi:MAG: hypothetical protein K0S41_2607 [Anaerocolumna sp.]|jgi:choice-of-anchor A domain-containing protein|nr:hypothetical protein [Anaerocolumna sp.]
MDNINYRNGDNVGIPYDDINWYDVEGQPFGVASRINLLVLGDADNIIDVEGAMAVGGNFTSPRGISVGFGRGARLTDTGYSANNARFITGGNVAMGGPLVVTGHVVVGGNFRAANGSTYLIGKDGSNNQLEELNYLYQTSGGSPYWSITDKGNHYVVPSYDKPRYIPASRIGANLPLFFQNARNSIRAYKSCIDELPSNGTVIEQSHEWVLRGNNPDQNVFTIDVRPNGLINKGIRAEVPERSLVIVKLRTGANAHLQYGVMGEQWRTTRTLFVFEDATDIHMEKPADIWGSILAPQARFHGHSTGGHVSGNAAVGSFSVNANSGFEFHLYPFVGGVNCGELPEQPGELPEVIPEVPVVPECPECPAPMPCPEAPECPAPVPCPAAPECPAPVPCPECPEQRPCPECPTCPAPVSCPECPEQRPCPECPSCPECPTCPVCPEQRPCPECPTCPEAETEYVGIPIPVPVQMPCPECPRCPEAETEYVGIPIPVPVQMPCPICPEQKPCPECLVKPGVIFGCIWGCYCCKSHGWEIKLYKLCNDVKTLLYCEKINCYGCFKFEVPYNGCYVLKVCPIDKCTTCKPILTLKNVGVSNFMVE